MTDSKKKIVRSTPEKTSVYVDGGVWREARHFHADTGKSLSTIMEEALERYLNVELVEVIADEKTTRPNNVDSRKVSGRRHN